MSAIDFKQRREENIPNVTILFFQEHDKQIVSKCVELNSSYYSFMTRH